MRKADHPEPIEHLVTDLAPGESGSSAFDWSSFEIVRISSTQDPRFNLVFKKLWEEFGDLGEIEPREILEQRLNWSRDHSHGPYWLKYELISVFQRGQFAAVRDHSVMIPKVTAKVTDKNSPPVPPAVTVHLSHVLIDPKHRGSGMSAWLRAWPIQSARTFLRAKNLPENLPITLVAEMEALKPDSASHLARLRSYQRGGFLMIDPARIQYYQPDFRAPEAIDSTGAPNPIPLRLVIRRIGRELEREISGAEVTEIVSALYHLFGSTFRYQDMKGLWNQLQSGYPHPDEIIQLIQPTSDSGKGNNL